MVSVQKMNYYWSLSQYNWRVIRIEMENLKQRSTRGLFQLSEQRIESL